MTRPGSDAAPSGTRRSWLRRLLEHRPKTTSDAAQPGSPATPPAPAPAAAPAAVAGVTAPTQRSVVFGGVDMDIVSRSRTEDRRAAAGKEQWTEDWILALPPDAVLWDVGANTGLFSLLACLAPGGEGRRAVAIEPAYLNVPGLVDNVRVNGLEDRVITLAVALGDRTMAGTLQHENLVPGGAMHSISEIAYFKPTRSTVSKFSQSVLVYRLDDLVGMPGLPFPTHLKIDVDGAEALLLQGAERTLADERIRGVQVEAIDQDEARAHSAFLRETLERAGLRFQRLIDHNEAYPRVSDLQFIR